MLILKFSDLSQVNENHVPETVNKNIFGGVAPTIVTDENGNIVEIKGCIPR